MEPDNAGQRPTAPESAPGQLLHTYAGASQRLTIPESWLRKAVPRKKIPHVRIGRWIRFREEDLHAIADLFAVEARTPPRIGRPSKAA